MSNDGTRDYDPFFDDPADDPTLGSDTYEQESDPWALLLAAVLHSDKIDRSRHHLELVHNNQHTRYRGAGKTPTLKHIMHAKQACERQARAAKVSMYKPQTQTIEEQPHMGQDKIDTAATVMRQMGNSFVEQLMANCQAIYDDLLLSEARQGKDGGGVHVTMRAVLRKRGSIHTHAGAMGWEMVYHPRVKLAESTYDQNEVRLPGM